MTSACAGQGLHLTAASLRGDAADSQRRSSRSSGAADAAGLCRYTLAHQTCQAFAAGPAVDLPEIERAEA